MGLPIKIELPDNFLEDEIRCDYHIEKKIKEVWAVELDLLHELDRVCALHSIPYYACAGTMLGAVRHNGMIPWDDDIDVMMFRDDYNRLCQYGNEFTHPYFFQTETTDKGSLRGHAQLRNSKTTGIRNYELPGKYNFNQGIFIDIFPLDNIPDSRDERERFLSEMMKSKKRYERLRGTMAHIKDEKSLMKRVIKSIISPCFLLLDKGFDMSHKMCLKYEQDSSRYSDIDTKQVGIISLAQLGDRFHWDKDCFQGECINRQFEFIEIPLPSGYMSMLTKTYGEWQIPKHESTKHGDVIFDARVSYKDYLHLKN